MYQSDEWVAEQGSKLLHHIQDPVYCTCSGHSLELSPRDIFYGQNKFFMEECENVTLFHENIFFMKTDNICPQYAHPKPPDSYVPI